MLRRGFTADEILERSDDRRFFAAESLETEIAMEVHSASTEGGYLTYEWGGRQFRVDLTLTEEN